MKKLSAFLIAIALAAGLCSCSLMRPSAKKPKETEPPMDAVITDSSVGEFHFTVPEHDYVDKTVEQRADGTRKNAELMYNGGVYLDILCVYDTELDRAIEIKGIYLENPVQEDHNGSVYTTCFFEESGWYFAAVENNGNTYFITYEADKATFDSFLDSASFAAEADDPIDFSFFDLSYQAPDDYDSISLELQENVGRGVIYKSLAWIKHESEGSDAMDINLIYRKDNKAEYNKQQGVDFTEGEVNGFSFLIGHENKRHYYLTQHGNDIYLIQLLWQEDENYPPFTEFLSHISLADSD